MVCFAYLLRVINMLLVAPFFVKVICDSVVGLIDLGPFAYVRLQLTTPECCFLACFYRQREIRVQPL